jgi:cobalt-zinc-cadmium efflux system membrane fusion protein
VNAASVGQSPEAEARTAEDEELGLLPKEPLRPGEHLLQSGVGELKAALLDKEAERAKDQKTGKEE